MKGPKLIANLNITLSGFHSAEQLKNMFDEVVKVIEGHGLEIEDIGGGIGIAVPKSDMQDMARGVMGQLGMTPEDLMDSLPDSENEDKPDDNPLGFDFDPNKYKN